MSYWINIFAELSEATIKDTYNRFKEQNPNVDPDVVKLYLQRWDSFKKAKNLKPLETYKTFKDLEESVKDLRTKKERELDKGKISEEHVKKVYKDGVWTAYSTNNPVALSKLAQGSAWCIRNPSTAEDYLKNNGTFTIVQKNGYPFAAIAGKNGGVWYKTDSDFESETSYGIKEINIFEDDYEKLQEIMEELGRPLNPQVDKIRTHDSEDGEAYVKQLIKDYDPLFLDEDKVQYMLAISGLTDGVGEIKALEAKFSDSGFDWLAYAQLVTHKANKKANEYAIKTLSEPESVEYLKIYNSENKQLLRTGIVGLIERYNLTHAVRSIKEFGFKNSDFTSEFRDTIERMIKGGSIESAHDWIMELGFDVKDFEKTFRVSVKNALLNGMASGAVYAVKNLGIDGESYKKEAIIATNEALNNTHINTAQNLVLAFNISPEDLDESFLRDCIYTEMFGDVLSAYNFMEALDLDKSHYKDEALRVVDKRLEIIIDRPRLIGTGGAGMGIIESLVLNFNLDTSSLRSMSIRAITAAMGFNYINASATLIEIFKLSHEEIKGIIYGYIATGGSPGHTINLSQNVIFLLKKLGLKPKDFGLDEDGNIIESKPEPQKEEAKEPKETPKEPEEKPQESQAPANPVKQQDKAESNREKLFSSWINLK